MIKCLSLVLFLTCATAGPWVGKPKPLASPPVDEVQWGLHQRLLALEPSVLQVSLDISRLAQMTTEECYRRTEEAASRLHSLASGLDQLVRRIRPVAPECVDNKSLRLTKKYLEDAVEDIYQCTHTLSDIAASFEVEMTEKMVAARAQIMDIKQAMWFCQKYQPKVDEECLRRLEAEGLQILDKLPERARTVMDRAQAEGAQSLRKLGNCLTRKLSACEEQHLSESQTMRSCFQKTLVVVEP